jgi:hypothetical protein
MEILFAHTLTHRKLIAAAKDHICANGLLACRHGPYHFDTESDIPAPLCAGQIMAETWSLVLSNTQIKIHNGPGAGGSHL